jgi:hypothetical protein
MAERSARLFGRDAKSYLELRDLIEFGIGRGTKVPQRCERA